MLITEALAELKTLTKRVEKKREYIGNFLYRPDGMRDPLEKDGGSVEVIKRETQALNDLNSRIIQIRTAIQRTNLNTPLTLGEKTQSIAEWLTWRKEISNGEQSFINKQRHTVLQARNQAQARGASVVTPGSDAKPTDIHVNVNEAVLAKQAEELEQIIGTLDGQLSLKNATINVEGL